MKIYLVSSDKYMSNQIIDNILNIEQKENCQFKSTKNDFTILFNALDISGLSKSSQIILVTENKDSKFIWDFINTYNCVDIIDSTLDRNYIIKRISDDIKDKQYKSLKAEIV